MIRIRTNSFDVIFHGGTLSIVERLYGFERSISIPNQECLDAVFMVISKARLKYPFIDDAPKDEPLEKNEEIEKEPPKSRSRKKKVE